MIPTAEVPQRLIASLNAARENSRIVLLVRHADRAPISPGQAGDEVGLLPVGVARAKALAHILEPFGGAAWSEASPLPRCMATARYVAQTVTPCNLLGDPGPFVVDREEGGRVFGRLGTNQVVLAQVHGHPWPFMRSLEDGSRLVLSHARACLESRPGVGLFVSHDAIVMPVIAWAAGYRFDGDWLLPLDGMVIALRDRKMLVWWAGHRLEVGT